LSGGGEGSGWIRVGLEAYGVRAVVSAASPELMARIEEVLPPGSSPSEPREGDKEFRLIAQDGAFYTVEANETPVTINAELDVAIGALDASLRAHIAVSAPDRVFVHAGAVGHRGKALVFPGPTFTGKSTLVAALVAAGAEYLSDEYAVLDEHARVHPYARRLSLRGEPVNGERIDTEIEVTDLGGTAIEEPLPVGLIATTLYRPGAVWDPQRLSSGEGVLSLLANTLAAQDHPERVFGPLSRAVEGAVVLEGERGDAAELAPRLLESVPW
jgi:hypothetical protein